MATVTALVIIDVQTGLMERMSPALVASALPRIATLVARARVAGTPVLYVQHAGEPGHFMAPGAPGWELHPEIGRLPADTIVGKRECDAFYESTLERELAARGVSRLVMAGAMTEYCTDTNCRRATSMGYDVALAGDAHITRGNKLLTAEQIVAHHNKLLQGFGAGRHRVVVKAAAEIDL